MAKPKAPAWLREAFRDGVDAFLDEENPTWSQRPSIYPCWLAPHDPARRECTGRLERFHFIRRQDVEATMWAQLLEAEFTPWVYRHAGRRGRLPAEQENRLLTRAEVWDLILIAAWDPRNGAHACEQHHRRYDNHQVGLPRDRIVVPYSALPSRVIQFGFDYSEGRLLDRFPSTI